MGDDVALLDLKKAYLQVHVEEALWPFQTVLVDGKRYCLTRLGFGLNVAPSVMKTVLETIAKQDKKVQEAVSFYLDDVLVNEEVLTAEAVAAHLGAYGLDCKPPVRVKEGSRVLGLRVDGEGTDLRWKRDNEVQDVKRPLTRRSVFSLCGRLTGHLPVCGWLRPASSYLKRRANSASSTWDGPIEDPQVDELVAEVIEKVKAEDPARGRWSVRGDRATVWVDASMLALGVAIEVDGEIVEDGCWLRPNDGTHINIAELDAAIKGVNLAILWGMSHIRLMTDSRTVYHWVTDTLSGKARCNTKAASEMLIRRRLSTLKMLAEEYHLTINVESVTSGGNRADVLTRVPERWLRGEQGRDELCCTATGASAAEGSDADGEEAQHASNEVKRIHHAMGHPGIRRTHFFAKQAMPTVFKSLARHVVRNCQICQSIDPAPVKWRSGELSVDGTWQRLAMDVTQYRGRSYLTLIDCGPSRFSIWRPLRLKTSAAVVQQLESVFLERGAPDEILTDNDPAFRSRRFEAFMVLWGVRLRFRCAYVPSGNGVAERSHRTVKTIAARKGCTIAEAVFLYNLTPLDDSNAETAPANRLYQYTVKVRQLEETAPDASSDAAETDSGYEPFLTQLLLSVCTMYICVCVSLLHTSL